MLSEKDFYKSITSEEWDMIDRYREESSILAKADKECSEEELEKLDSHLEIGVRIKTRFHCLQKFKEAKRALQCQFSPFQFTAVMFLVKSLKWRRSEICQILAEDLRVVDIADLYPDVRFNSGSMIGVGHSNG